MLAKPGAIPESDSEEWAYEIKWDGVRVLGYANHGRWRMMSRRQEEVTARYPELEAIAEAIGDHAAVLDGEVVALDKQGRPRFQLIQSRMGLASAAAVKARMKEQPVDYVIFDLLHLDGRRVRDLPYLERRELLEGLGLDGPRWRVPTHRLDGGPDLLEAARRQGLEGIVAKHTDSPYRPGKRTESGSRRGSGAARSSSSAGTSRVRAAARSASARCWSATTTSAPPRSTRAMRRRCTSPEGSARG